MSLEQQVSTLVDSTNRLTKEVTEKQQQIDARVKQKLEELERWQQNITAPQMVLTVGEGKQFSSIIDAWNSLSSKILQQPVLIKVSDGVYQHSDIRLYHHPYAHLITIEGNIAEPQKCVIQWVPDSNKLSHGLILVGVKGLTIGGFKFIAETTESNFTYRSIRVAEQSSIKLIKESIIIEGGEFGIQVFQQSFLAAEGVKIAHCIYWGVQLNATSLASLPNLQLTGLGKDKKNRYPSHVGGGGEAISNGILVHDCSVAALSGSIISHIGHGIYASYSSYCWLGNSKISHAYHGVFAEFCAAIAGRSSPNAPLTVTDSVFGFVSKWSSQLMIIGAIADRCHYGFHAEAIGAILAVNSAAKNCTAHGYHAGRLSYIEALHSQANSINNKTQYSPATSNVVGNINSVIYYS